MPLLLRCLALAGLLSTLLLASAFQAPSPLLHRQRQGRRAGVACRMQQQAPGQQDGVSRLELLKRGTLAAQVCPSIIHKRQIIQCAAHGFTHALIDSPMDTPQNKWNQVAAGAFFLGRRPALAVEDDEPPAASASAAGAAAADGAPAKPLRTAYDYEIPYDGERVPLSKFRGKAVVVCNAKSDDPEALNQMPALAYLNGKYFKDGLKIWCFTTEQVRVRGSGLVGHCPPVPSVADLSPKNKGHGHHKATTRHTHKKQKSTPGHVRDGRGPGHPHQVLPAVRLRAVPQRRHLRQDRHRAYHRVYCQCLRCLFVGGGGGVPLAVDRIDAALNE